MHTHTLGALSNLGLLLQEQGKLDEAAPLLQRAMQCREAVLGPMHPSFHQSISNYTLLLQVQGRLDEAAPLLQRMLDLAATLPDASPTPCLSPRSEVVLEFAATVLNTSVLAIELADAGGITCQAAAV